MPLGIIPFPFGKCRICQDKATGLHYGVATCEGCKGFFKRSTLRGTKYTCYFGGNCEITPKNRNRCKSCRYKRCNDVGMSLDAVRMGRIPKVEKDKVLEVFQQCGSDYNKLELSIQQTEKGQYNFNLNASNNDAMETDNPVQNENKAVDADNEKDEKPLSLSDNLGRKSKSTTISCCPTKTDDNLPNCFDESLPTSMFSQSQDQCSTQHEHKGKSHLSAQSPFPQSNQPTPQHQHPMQNLKTYENQHEAQNQQTLQIQNDLPNWHAVASGPEDLIKSEPSDWFSDPKAHTLQFNQFDWNQSANTTSHPSHMFGNTVMQQRHHYSKDINQVEMFTPGSRDHFMPETVITNGPPWDRNQWIITKPTHDMRERQTGQQSCQMFLDHTDQNNGPTRSTADPTYVDNSNWKRKSVSREQQQYGDGKPHFTNINKYSPSTHNSRGSDSRTAHAEASFLQCPESACESYNKHGVQDVLAASKFPPVSLCLPLVPSVPLGPSVPSVPSMPSVPLTGVETNLMDQNAGSNGASIGNPESDQMVNSMKSMVPCSSDHYSYPNQPLCNDMQHVAPMNGCEHDAFKKLSGNSAKSPLTYNANTQSCSPGMGYLSRNERRLCYALSDIAGRDLNQTESGVSQQPFSDDMDTDERSPDMSDVSFRESQSISSRSSSSSNYSAAIMDTLIKLVSESAARKRFTGCLKQILSSKDKNYMDSVIDMIQNELTNMLSQSVTKNRKLTKQGNCNLPENMHQDNNEVIESKKATLTRFLADLKDFPGVLKCADSDMPTQLDLSSQRLTRDKNDVVGSTSYQNREVSSTDQLLSTCDNQDDIEMSITSLSLAMKILYRLKPEHREKIKLFKMGKIQLRVMTDSDEDVEFVYDRIMSSIPLLNERVFGFCEHVPGFTKISKDGRSKLLKSAFYDIWMLTFAEYFTDGKSNIILSTGELYSIEAMRKILNDEIVDEMLNFSEQFNALQLTDLEITTLCGVQLTKINSVEIEDTQLVRQSHSHLMDVFVYLIKLNHPCNYSQIITKLFQLLPLLEEINRLQKTIIAPLPTKMKHKPQDV